MTGRIDSLQVLRFLAAALVAGLHIEQQARALDGLSIYGGWFTQIGMFGVDVFFVLSGFIIARTAAGKSPGEFLWLRLTRVVPLYWLLTAVMLPFLIQAGEFTWTPLVSTLTFYPGPGRLPYLGVGWTLCFEMLFYVATAVVLHRPHLLVPLFLGAFALCWGLREWIGGPFRFFGNPLILEFLAGVVIARADYRSRIVGLAAAAAAVAVLAVIAVNGAGPINRITFIINGDLALQRVLLFGPPAACLVYAALQVEAKRGRLSRLGDASYALYLVHPIVMAALLLLAPKSPGLLFAPVAFGLSLLAAVAAHRWLEQPLIAGFRQARPALAPT